MNPNIPEVTVQELKAKRDAGEAPFLLDVREEAEYATSNLGGTLIPLGQLPVRIEELETHRNDAQIVVHCRSGGRSARAVQYLHSLGFTNAVNLKGGMLAWRDQIDSEIEVA